MPNAQDKLAAEFAERAFGIADTALDAARKALPAEAKAELVPF